MGLGLSSTGSVRIFVSFIQLSHAYPCGYDCNGVVYLVSFRKIILKEYSFPFPNYILQSFCSHFSNHVINLPDAITKAAGLSVIFFLPISYNNHESVFCIWIIIDYHLCTSRDITLLFFCLFRLQTNLLLLSFCSLKF